MSVNLIITLINNNFKGVFDYWALCLSNMRRAYGNIFVLTLCHVDELYSVGTKYAYGGKKVL